MESHARIHVLLEQKRYREAESAIREQLDSNVEDPLLFFLLALSLLNQDKPKEAENAARESLRIDPDFDMGHFVLSRALLEQSNPREALKAIHEALRIDPDDPDFHSQEAQIHTNRSKYKEALASAEAGLQSDPDHSGCLFFRSAALEHLGRSDEAEDVSLSLLENDPEDPQSHCVRGWILAERGETDDAERHFLEALRLYPDYEDARDGLCYVMKLRNPVLGWILKALILLGRVPIWWALLGLFLTFRLGDFLEDSDFPQPLPFLGLLLRAFLYGFFVMTLLVNPLFHLLLAKSRRTRIALSERQIKGVKWYLIPSVIALVFLALWYVSGAKSHSPIFAIGWAALTKLTFETFESNHPWVTLRMSLLAWAAFAVLLFTHSYQQFVINPSLFELLREVANAAKEGTEGELDTFKERMLGPTERKLAICEAATAGDMDRGRIL